MTYQFLHTSDMPVVTYVADVLFTLQLYLMCMSASTAIMGMHMVTYKKCQNNNCVSRSCRCMMFVLKTHYCWTDFTASVGTTAIRV